MFQSKFDLFEGDKELRAFFHAETVRKDALCDLFYEFEVAERKIRKPPGAVRKYEKMFKGTAQVVKKSGGEITLVKESGKVLGVLKISPEIGAYVRLYDIFQAAFGYRDGEWRMICLLTVGSQFTPDPNPALN